MRQRTPRSFTPDQERAITAVGREVMVVAPAGSGKTEVLIQRVIRALERSAGEAFRILVVTFTVKAAEELKRRARESIADELWRLDADTIHGFALDWLRRYGTEVGVGPDVVVLSDDVDRAAIVAGYLQSIGLSSDPAADGGGAMGELLRAIDAHRTRLRQRHCDRREDYRHRGVSLEELADSYGAAMRAQGAIDFPGMLLSLADLLDEDPWVLEHFQSLYRCILVDEGQDLTAIQSDLLRRLAGDVISLFVVADDRQSIRGYAGGGFLHAQELVPSAAHAPLHLHHNFRCAREILRAAQAVLRPADDRPVVPLDNAPPGEVGFFPMESPEVEANWIASWISRLLDAGLRRDTLSEGEDPSVAPEDVAVAARTRWTLGPIIEALTRNGIVSVVQTDARVFLPAPEARLFIDCLAFGVNHRDVPAARRVLDELRELTKDDLPSDPVAALSRVPSDALRSVGALVTRCLQGNVQFQHAMEEVSEAGERHGWPAGARALAEIWEAYRTTAAVQDRSPRGYLTHLAKTLRTRPTDPGVRLLTMDRAKGLEFKAVALVGMRDGQVPDYRASSSRERGEERRRLYVAMTRAARELVVTWPIATVDRYGQTHSQDPSPFLVEAGLLGADANPT